MYEYKYAQTLTLFQSIFTLACLLALRRFKVVDFPNIDFNLAKRIAPLSVVFLGYVVVSLIALGRVNIPMFTALRRTTVVFVMILEQFMHGNSPDSRILKPVAIMVLGATIAALKDLTFDPVSYVLVFLTNLFTALYTISIASVKRESNLSVFAMLFYNTTLTLPMLVVLGLLTGDIQASMTFEHYNNPAFMVCFFFSCTLAMFMNVATYFSTSMNGATTQSVIGQLKNFVAFILGLVMFSDYLFDPINFAGLLIGFGGGVWYSYIQTQKQPTKAKQLPSHVQEVSRSADESQPFIAEHKPEHRQH